MKESNLLDQSIELNDNKSKAQTKLDFLKNPYQQTMKSLSSYKEDSTY
jgi:hypothetical protein